MLSAGRRSPTACSPRRAGSRGRAARGVREAAESHVIVATSAGATIPPRAAARGRPRRPAAGRALRAPPALARALERQAEETGEDALITAGIAHHYRRPATSARPSWRRCAPRTPPSACTPTARRRAARARARPVAARRRAPAQAGSDRDELLPRAGRALINDGGYVRAEQLLRVRGEVDEAAEPRRRRPARARCRAPWWLGRASDARLDRPRGGVAAGGRPQPGARADPRAPGKAAMLQRRFSEACRPPRRRRRRPPRRAEAPLADALNAIGPLADPDRQGRGRQSPRCEAIRFARGSSARARVNLAERCTSSAARMRARAPRAGACRHRERGAPSATGRHSGARHPMGAGRLGGRARRCCARDKRQSG